MYSSIGDGRVFREVNGLVQKPRAMQIDRSGQGRFANSHFERRVSLKFLCCITAGDRQKLHYRWPGERISLGTCFRLRF